MSLAPLSLSSQSRRTTDSPITSLIQQAFADPRLISLAAGLVDEESLPASAIAGAVAEVLATPASAKAALQYGTTQGLGKLRQHCVDRLCAADGKTPAQMNLSAADVILTTGSQQLLYLLCETLFDVGDIVITEAPSYFVYHNALASSGVRVLTVPMDEEGLNTAALVDLLTKLDRAGELPRVRVIYTVDYFQNPSGLSLSVRRRQELVEIAQRFSTGHRILILEDAAYRELRYEGPDLPSIKSFDPTNDFVIWAATFSKPLAPGLKTGYGILPRGLMEPVCHIKSNHDFGSSNLAQHAIERLIASGAYDRHLVDLRRAYTIKRDAALSALEREFADWPQVQWTKAQGGLYVWVTFPPHIETGPGTPLMNAALKEGVLYVPGVFCHVAGPNGTTLNHEMRLSFGVASPAKIDEAIVRLRRAARAAQKANQPALAAV